jgi:hypothetical protein
MKESMDHWWNDSDGRKPEQQERKICPNASLPTKISHEMTWHRNRAAMLRVLVVNIRGTDHMK